MTKTYNSLIILFLLMAFNTSNAKAQCGTNLLTNPSFETTVQPSIGNNLTGLFTFNDWTMTGGPFNVIKTNGSAYGGGPNNAQNGTQYIDITSGAGTIYQDFSITSASAPIAFGGYFSSREPGGYVNWTASIQIFSMPSNTLVATSNTRDFTAADGGDPAQEVWHYIFGNATLTAGAYRYVVNLGNYGNFDNAFVNENCTLPIILSYFSGQSQGNENRLAWKVEQQTNFSHFEIERSIDGVNFSTIKEISQTNNNTYNYSDYFVTTATTLFYRLKMVDLDGSFKYSNIIKIQTKGTSRLTIMPNTVSEYLTVSGLNIKGQIRVVDLSGKVLFKKTVESQALSIDVSFMKSGFYLLQYLNGNDFETLKFFKQ